MEKRFDGSSMDKHVIQDVSFYRVRARYPRLHGKNAIKGDHGYGGSVDLAVISTNKGAQGWAMLSGSVREARKLVPDLVGGKLSDFIEPDEGIKDSTLKAFDLPLHDLAGHVLGVPVSHFISTHAVTKVRVYDGAIYMNDIIPEDQPYGIEKVVQDCMDDYVIGHRMLKIKIGRGNKWMAHEEGMRRDIDIVRAIHDALPDVTLMVDGNDGFTVDDCIAFLEGIRGIEVYWFEEPFRESEQANARLKNYLRENRPATYIADGESFTDIPLLMDLAEKGLLDVWQPDVCGYGFTAWRKLLKKIVPLGYLSSPHAWGQVLKTHYCAHLAAAYPHHIPCIEAVLGETEGVDYGGYELKNGMLTLPDKPGFGMRFFWGEQIED